MNALFPRNAIEAAEPTLVDRTRDVMPFAFEAPTSVGTSTSDLLRNLRQEFPNSPLAVRVRALEALRRR